MTLTRGRFIVFEGGEAAGKSTQVVRLGERLSAVITREPGGSDLGELVREVVLSRADVAIGARAEALLMLADRAQHVDDVIAPALDACTDVVCDRFSGSTLAYQGGGRGLDRAELEFLCDWSASGLRPDLTILLDGDPATLATRRGGATDRMEAAGVAFHTRVREAFLDLGTRVGWYVIDATKTIDEIAREIDAAVEGLA